MSLFDISSKKKELQELENQTQSEDFWQKDTSLTTKILVKVKDLKKKNAFLSGTRFIVKIIAITKNFYWYEDSECTHTDWKRRRRFPL